MAALEAQIAKLSVSIQGNMNRLTNTDSSIGMLCNLLDLLYDGMSPPRDCCFEDHTASQTGNFMLCINRRSATYLFGNAGRGVCATDCSGLAPEHNSLHDP